MINEDALRKFVLILKREGMFHDNRLNAFQKTEQLLYRYNDFIGAVSAKKKLIEELKKHGLKRQSKSITKYGAGSGEVKTEQEKLEDKIEVLENSIDDTEQYIRIINAALDSLKDDRFYEIIPKKFFEDMSHEEIGEAFEVDASTIGRNKNRLVRKLSIQLFPDESLCEMLS